MDSIPQAVEQRRDERATRDKTQRKRDTEEKIGDCGKKKPGIDTKR